MQELVKRGRTSNIFVVFLADIGSLVGGGKTGLTSSSSGLIIAVRRELAAACTAYSGSNVESITTLGTFAAPSSGKCRFKEIDATNQPGMYELQFADSVLDASDASRFLTGMIQANGIANTPFRIPLVAIDQQDVVRLGLTALVGLAGITGTVTTDAGNSATSFETDLASSTNDFYKDMFLVITSGALQGQVKKVSGYTGATKIIAVSGGFTGTPADGTTFRLVNF